ncbi:MAG: DUF2807 domain-containing protein [Saprospiraceae bacterium]|nr:DUF2807 domain-containing protein [Saprospiraceae bacterium]
MKNLVSALLVVFAITSISTVNGQSSRDIGNFDRIAVSTSVKVELIKSNTPNLEFKMLSGNEDHLITEVKNNTLIVKIKSGMFNGNNNSKASVKVYYTSLDGIKASAGSAIRSANTITSSSMDVDVSSGAKVDLEIETGTIEVEASSGAIASIDGSADKGMFEVSSGANINASDMECDHVSAEASSGGQIRVHANKKLTAEASSGGMIKYKGDADYTDTDAGRSGQIKRMK